MRRITRRDAVKTMAAGLAAPALARMLGSGPALAVDDGTPPGSSWTPIPANPVVATTGTTPENLRFHPSLLPAGWLLSDPIDAWYLWTSTHDSPTKFHLYTAPTPEGPYTFRNFIAPPSPFPSTHRPNHWSAPDVVWDPVGQRFIATPHTARTFTPGAQDSFLIQSTDGISWTWVGPARTEARVRRHAGRSR